MKKILLALCLAFATTVYAADHVQVINPYNMQDYDAAIQKIYAALPPQDNTLEKVKQISGAFVNKPYLLGALGEGQAGKFDQSPLYRTDAFDCMTFVSTVLALVESNNLAQFQQNIVAVNYQDGVPDFLTRNHFTTIDWNVINANHGFIKDVTRALFPNDYRIAVAYIDRPAWFRKLSPTTIKVLNKPNEAASQQLINNLHELANQTTPKMSRLAYVPLTALFDNKGNPIAAKFALIPDAAIIEIVRPNWNLKDKIGTNLNVSHMGLMIVVNGQQVFRQASSQQNKIVDVSLADYLKKYLQSDTVKGINIEKIIVRT